MRAIGLQAQTAIKASDGAPVHYERHRPERTTLYCLVQQHAAAFFEQAQTAAGAHRKLKRPPKPDDQTAASQDGPRRDVCGSEIVAAAPIRTVSPLPLGLVGP